MLECNIDDMPGEIYSYLMDILLSEGALDVTYTSLQMKKNRPGVKISVLCDENKLERIEKVLLSETSTFGIRKYPVERSILEREFKRHQTPFGELTFKFGYYEGELIKVTPEYEELKVVAKEMAMPLISVYGKVQEYIEKELL